MSPSDPARVHELFVRVCDLDPDERAKFLDEACGADADLRAEVESLLAYDGKTPEIAAAGPSTTQASTTTDGPTHPDRIGPYKILQKLGEGGMGVVYLAEQTDPRRRVALKVIKRGMDTKQVIARFEAERQALALMDHPNIAKVFDAGATAEGRPYFAMEYVKGVPITKHCDTHRLTTRQRLDLFTDACKGVQHAHQKAVIHRDIKPSNVLVALVDGQPVPKIIDFGVAKATAQRLTEKTMFTAVGVMVGTPEYMSPEQADLTSQDVDTRTDVYSLGVVMYELLVGALPFDPKELRGAGFDEIRRKIREDEPSKPSTKLTTLGDASSACARKRRTDPRSLARQVRGDLDWITMKALEKDRGRRYNSPSELAADVNRYLMSEPVAAGPPSAAYRFRKFLGRNRLQVGIALGAVVLSTSLAILSVQAKRLATLEQQQLVERLLSSGVAAGSTPELEALYDQFAQRLDSGNTTLAEKQLFLSAAVQSELEVRRVWGLRLPAKARMLFKHAVDLEARGITAIANTRYTLNGTPIGKSTYRHGLPPNSTAICDADLDLNLLTYLVAPAELSLEAETTISFYDSREEEEVFLLADTRHAQQTIQLLGELPEDYPLALASTGAINAVESTFHVYWFHFMGDEDFGIWGIRYQNDGPIDLVGRLDVVSLGQATPLVTDEPFSPTRGRLGFSSASASPLKPSVYDDIQQGRLRTVRLRLLPDRGVALNDPSIRLYYGRAIERVVPVLPTVDVDGDWDEELEEYAKARSWALRKRKEESLSSLQQLVQGGWADPIIMEDPDFAFLHGDPEFEAIVAEVRKRVEQK